MKGCKHCGKEIPKRNTYCDNTCQQGYQTTRLVVEWYRGKNFTRRGGTSIPQWMRNYLLEEVNNKCTQCGWGEKNLHTDTVMLEIDHIDGDAYNNLKENLRVLCPNCHSLTKTFKNVGNRNSTRINR